MNLLSRGRLALRKHTKLMFYLTLLAGLSLLIIGCKSTPTSPPPPSQEGLQLIQEGKYDEAASHFLGKQDDIYNYCKGKDSYEKNDDLQETRQYTEKISKDYDGKLKEEILEFKSMIYDESIKHGFSLVAEGKYDEAYDWFLNVECTNKGSDYASSDIYNYSSAIKYYHQNNYKMAKEYTEKIGDYSGCGADEILAFKEKALKELPAKIAAQEAEERERIAAQEAAEKERIAAQKAAEEVAEKARRKQEGVRIGMTRQEVIESSWGKPLEINRTVTAYGVYEQWVYNNYNYLYFEDGILTAIQN